MDNWNGIVSLFIACIEFILIINLVVLAPKTRLNKLSITIVTLLFVYQLLEFLMCHFGYDKPFMAYFAFVDITFLPPLSLYAILTLLNYRGQQLSRLFFLPGLSFIIYYALIIPEFKVVSCTVLYAAFNYPYGTIYGIFYYLPLLIGMILLLVQIRGKGKDKVTFLSKILFTGYIFTFLPVVAAFLFAAAGQPLLLSAVESIMCKFAVILAFAFGFVCLYGRTPRGNNSDNPPKVV